ncbi:MAG: HAD family hydrolase [Acetatifactor sp.]|nr:HAD family hydrolase [Acetatifactor sp.]
MFEGVEWLFFDIGNTLFDEQRAFEHRLYEMAQEAGVEYDWLYREAIALYGQHQKGDLGMARRLGIELPKWHREDEAPYGDAQECLRMLSRKYKIGVIANQSPGTAERLEKYGLLRYIDLVVASAEEGVSKPDHRIFQIALDKSGCTPARAVMIGDRVDNDIIPAKAMGMHTIWLRCGIWRDWQITGEQEQADCVVHSLAEICKYL